MASTTTPRAFVRSTPARDGVPSRADLASAFDPLTLANVLEVKATANAGGFPDGASQRRRGR